MKKLVSVLVVAVLAFGCFCLFGCGSSGSKALSKDEMLNQAIEVDAFAMAKDIGANRAAAEDEYGDKVIKIKFKPSKIEKEYFSSSWFDVTGYGTVEYEAYLANPDELKSISKDNEYTVVGRTKISDSGHNVKIQDAYLVD